MSWPASPGCSPGAASTSTPSPWVPPRTRRCRGSRSPLDGAAHPIDQVTKQLHKLVNVIKIRDLEPADTVARELALFKISCHDGDARAQVMQFTEIFRGSVVDVSKRSVTVEVTGTDDKIESFEDMVRPFGLIEMVRTGEIAVARGRGARSLRSRPTGAPSPPHPPSFGVAVGSTHEDLPFALAPAAERLLHERAERAVALARRHGGPAVASVTVRSPPASTCRRWSWPRGARGTGSSASSSPSASGFVLAGLGAALSVEASGAGRFAEAPGGCASSASRTLADDAGRDPGRPPAAGPVFVGGFAFADDGGGSPEWSSLAPATLVLPEVSLARYGEEARLTSVSPPVPMTAGRARGARPRAARRAGAGHHAAARSRPGGAGARGGRRRAVPLRGTPWGARSSASPPASSRRSCSRARCGCTARRTTTRRRCSTRSVRPSPPATAGVWARPSSRSWEPARSCWCAATAPAPRPWPWPAPRVAAPTRRWTTTSASSCSRARRTARNRRSWPGASSARSSRSASGWRQPTSPGWPRSRTSSTSRPRYVRSSPARCTCSSWPGSSTRRRRSAASPGRWPGR